MMLKKIALVAAAASMAIAPAMAQSSAAKLSPTRAATVAKHPGKLTKVGTGTLILAGAGLAAIIGGIIIALRKSNPKSP